MRKPRGFYDKEKYQEDCLAEFIEGRRKTLNMSQGELGAEIGMTQQAFSYRLKERNFTFMQIVKLFNVLQATDEEKLRLLKTE